MPRFMHKWHPDTNMTANITEEKLTLTGWGLGEPLYSHAHKDFAIRGLCEIRGDPFPCEAGWKFNQIAGTCVKFYEDSALLHHRGAQQNCLADGGHLASIGSEEEFQWFLEEKLNSRYNTSRVRVSYPVTGSSVVQR